jgi:hypothetical protein
MRLRRMLPFGKEPAEEEDPEETERKRKKALSEAERKPFSADVGRKVGILNYRRKKQMIDELDEE